MSHPIRILGHMSNRQHLRLVADHVESADSILSIDCNECAMNHTSACADCVVSYIVDREIGRPIELGDEEVRAMELLAEAGLVPGSRFQCEEPVA